MRAFPRYPMMCGLVFGVLLSGAVLSVEGAERWAPAPGPLLTRWANQVTPQTVHPEYPRPQLVRKEWLNLNGLWDYAIRPKEPKRRPEQFDGKILVPFPVESALSGVMKRVDEKVLVWYRRTFVVPKSWKGRQVLLHFGAVDWQATVWVNGEKAGEHQGGYDSWSLNITRFLKPQGEQEVVVAVWDPTDKGGQARGKQVLQPRGIWYTPTTGIWQTVWLEPVARTHVRQLKITPLFDESQVEIIPTVTAASPGTTVEVEVLENGRRLSGARLTASAADLQNRGLWAPVFKIQVPDFKPWTPQKPFLYDVRVQVKQQGSVCDSLTSYFGMRKVSVGKSRDGHIRILLNNRFVFQIGFLDQGFWPDGLYTAPSDAALRYDIEMTKKLGMNLARKHVKIEPERWYYWCDKLGLLVWQDMPSGTHPSPQERKQFEWELHRMIEQHYNHPCIIMWVVFNEGWGQYDTERLVKAVKQWDPTRLVNEASGWHHKGFGDVVDMHRYPGPAAPKPEQKRASVLGEFGGLGLPVKGHLWSKDWWGYRGFSSKHELTRKYVQLLRRVYKLKDEAGLSAAVYTQTTDVERECNGLMTYDRAVLKPEMELVAQANRGDFPPEPKKVSVVPCAQDGPVQWRYTFSKPGANWFSPDFDDSDWKVGPAGFGNPTTPGSVVRTQWRTSDIWIRRTFELKELPSEPLLLWLHHDEDAEVYLNGVLAAKAMRFTHEYELTDIRPEALKTLHVGKNVLAVHCHQTRGGQYIDVGLVKLIPPEKKKEEVKNK